MTRLSYRLLAALAVMKYGPLQAEEVFNTHALEIDNPTQETADLSLFSSSDGQLPGTYLVTVYINGELKGDEQHIQFVVNRHGKLSPLLTPAMLRLWGVNTAAFLPHNNNPVADLERLLPMATAEFIFNQLRLNISIPQAAMLTKVDDASDSAAWDQGVTAALLNYDLSGGHGWQGAGGDRYYANLQSGINLGAYRWRNYSTWSHNDSSRGRWQSISQYLQRDIAALRSRLTLGDSYTPPEVFAGMPFRGAQLGSDDNMLADNQRGFAPVIRGIAHSSAEVTVKQNDYTILRTYVPPGAFTLDNLYPVSAGGDLTVIVREADGREHSFVQPFSAVPGMQREGRLKYSVTAGKYRHRGDKPAFTQFTSMRGFAHEVTLYGGVQYARDYQAYALGTGVGMGMSGAVSADVTLAQALPGKGTSYRLLYSKSLPTTGTTIALAGYRYSTGGFYTFAEALDAGHSVASANRRQRLQLDLSQRISSAGSLYLSAWRQNYWHKKAREHTFSGGWSSQLYGVSYSILLSKSYAQTAGLAGETQLAMNIQIPLSGRLANSWMNISTSSVKNGATRSLIGIGGNTLADRNLSYNLQQSYAKRGGAEENLNVNYKGQSAEIDLGYSGGGTRLINYGLKGGAVLHPFGLTFSQPLAEQLAIIRTPGAEGVKVQNFPGVSTDASGNAVIPYVTPYRRNSLMLDIEDLQEDVDIDSSVKTVIPTQGAVVVASYPTRIGHRVLLSLSWKGKPVPFGAIVTASSPGSGIVGNDGVVYLSGIQDEERLTVSWNKTGSCSVFIKLPPDNRQPVIRLREACR